MLRSAMPSQRRPYSAEPARMLSTLYAASLLSPSLVSCFSTHRFGRSGPSLSRRSVGAALARRLGAESRHYGRLSRTGGSEKSLSGGLG